MRSMRTLLASMVFLAACGGSSHSPATTTTQPAGGEGSGSAAAAVLPDVPFDKLEPMQKAEFMKQKVMPAMEPIFKNHDATKYAQFGCQTCHGEGVEKHEFKMPNPKLPVLDFKDMSKYKPEDLKWMGDEVKPTMAKILGVPEHTKDNPNGFGCLECHTAAGM
jgi:hypothetical protein